MLDKAIADALRATSTGTITTILLKKGIRRTWLRGPRPTFHASERIVGPAFPLRFVPAREDLATPESWSSPTSTRGAIEAMPEGAIAIADAMGVTDAGIFGDILCARMKKRGVAALVTDGVMRDGAGCEATGLPIWCAGIAAPASVASLTFVGWGEPIGCGGIAIFPDDVIVMDGDGAVVIPQKLVEDVAKLGPEQELLEMWIMKEVERGVPLPGLYPPNEEAKARYEAERAKGESGDVFVLSKVVWFFTTPSNLLIALAFLGAVFACARRPRLARFGRRMGIGALLLVAMLGMAPVGTWLLYPLEERFPAYVEDGRPLAGVIVLGGAVLPNLSFARRQLVAGDAAERVIAFADLARRRPDLRLIFSGGSGAILGDDVVEAAAVARFGATLGFETARVTWERTSRTTAENARETKLIVPPDADARWLLVTSAWHMPRAVGAFRAVGIDVVPYPVDYRTSPDRLWRPEPSIASGLDRSDTAIREWIGLLVYRLTGRASALFPAP